MVRMRGSRASSYKCVFFGVYGRKEIIEYLKGRKHFAGTLNHHMLRTLIFGILDRNVAYFVKLLGNVCIQGTSCFES